MSKRSCKITYYWWTVYWLTDFLKPSEWSWGSYSYTMYLSWKNRYLQYIWLLIRYTILSIIWIIIHVFITPFMIIIYWFQRIFEVVSLIFLSAWEIYVVLECLFNLPKLK